MILFCAEIGLPSWFVAPRGVIRPVYTKHARSASLTDRYGKIVLPAAVNLDAAKIVEIGVEDSEVKKIVYRTTYNNLFDLVLVLIPVEWVCKTVWLNSFDDNHKTLRADRYARV